MKFSLEFKIVLESYVEYKKPIKNKTFLYGKEKIGKERKERQTERREREGEERGRNRGRERKKS